MADQLYRLILVEGGGGGNRFESYNLPWYFAAAHTEHDSLIKRGKKGYLFTIGDEQAPGNLTMAQIKAIIGDKLEAEMSTEEMLAEVQRKYEVYHVVIMEGDYARGHLDEVMKSWTKLLGQHVIKLSDYTKLAEVIVSAISMAEGADAVKATKKWGGAVLDAVKGLPRGRAAKLALGS